MALSEFNIIHHFISLKALFTKLRGHFIDFLPISCNFQTSFVDSFFELLVVKYPETDFLKFLTIVYTLPWWADLFYKLQFPHVYLYSKTLFISNKYFYNLGCQISILISSVLLTCSSVHTIWLGFLQSYRNESDTHNFHFMFLKLLLFDLHIFLLPSTSWKLV